MWACPDCGRSFANKNQWHSCLDLTVAAHLADKTDTAVALFNRVVEALESCGEFRVHAQKTRIAFITRMTFGGVKLAREWADLSLILPNPVDDARIRRLELFGPTSWGTTIRLSTPGDVDLTVTGWLCEALRRGNQETLNPKAEVNPLADRLLGVFRTAFRGRVEQFGGEEVILLPGYVADALAVVESVSVRIEGVAEETLLERVRGRAFFRLGAGAGLGAGDEVDVLLRVGGTTSRD